MPSWVWNRGAWTAIACLAAIVVAAAGWIYRSDLSWLVQVPRAIEIPTSTWINVVISAIQDVFRPVFRLLASLLDTSMRGLQQGLLAVPWSVQLVVLTLATYRVAGWKLAGWVAATCIYVVLAGYWTESINSLTLVAFGLPLACFLGALLGIAAHANRHVAPVVEALLDIMQTVPAFAYLTPLIVLFGFGPVAGLIASVLFALPPMARNVKLGLDNTPVESIEAAEIFGCSRLQTFAFVRVGAATRQILMGINQTIMATLSMVIFAAVIGGFEDIGWEVLRAARKAEFGDGILSGIVVTLLAILLDRVSEAAFVRRQQYAANIPPRYYWGLTFIAGAVTWLAIAPALPPLAELSVRRDLSPYLSGAVAAISVSLASVTDGLKSFAMTYFLLPLRIGLVNTVTPGIWGYELTPTLIALYAAVVCGSALALALRRHIPAALGVLFCGLLLYTGFLGFPWLPLLAGVALIGWWLGGLRLAAMSLLGLAAIALSGMWQSTMFAAYLMAAAITTSIVIGGLIGVLAAEWDRASRMLRPVNDFLQTFPPFVILIPLIMFFQVGDFSAYLAIVAYAIVPMIRYTEKGLRHVPVTQLEAGVLAGCTRLQLLCFVKFPAARGDLLLGLNQSIMAALAMLAVAALVGSRGLGQDVYVALSKADPGLGLLAGLCIATLAIITDRFVRQIARMGQADAPAAVG